MKSYYITKECIVHFHDTHSYAIDQNSSRDRPVDRDRRVGHACYICIAGHLYILNQSYLIKLILLQS